MTGATHWPFGQDKSAEARFVEQREMVGRGAGEARKKLRLDRLLVGGRAHTRKAGLS